MHKNRHIAEVATVLMSEKNMLCYYWVEAMFTIVHIMNIPPTTAVHDVMPEDRFIGRKPDLSHLKVFAFFVYVHVANELRTKLNPKAQKYVFIGYALEQKGYKCSNPITRELRVSKHVVCNEMESWYGDIKDDLGVDIKECVVAQNVGQQSHVLSRLRGSSLPLSLSLNKPSKRP